LKVILFSGKAESGKTASALIVKKLLEEKGRKVIKLAYGDYVKYNLKLIYNWDGNKDEQGRKLLQHFGTDMVKAKNPLFWINTIIELLKVIQDDFNYVLIDDCRFPEEVNSYDYHDWYYWIFRIERPNHKSKLTEEQLLHISETALDNYNFDDTLTAENFEQLEKEVKEKIVDRIIAKEDSKLE
jgi:hypothetical protein